MRDSQGRGDRYSHAPDCRLAEAYLGIDGNAVQLCHNILLRPPLCPLQEGIYLLEERLLLRLSKLLDPSRTPEQPYFILYCNFESASNC